jgi:8-oxo-dGTP pyrophosphatase MutT (NUDIX family)
MPKRAAAKASKRSAAAATASPGHPPRLQVGALCWRWAAGGVFKVLLITSRDTGRWVIPKGWPMRKRSEAEAAAREAFEEAGARGDVDERAVGLFSYDKQLSQGRAVSVLVRVFALQVRSLVRKYPEYGQRRIKWFAADKAARKVAEPELAALIRAVAAERTAARDAPETVRGETGTEAEPERVPGADHASGPDADAPDAPDGQAAAR